MHTQHTKLWLFVGVCGSPALAWADSPPQARSLIPVPVSDYPRAPALDCSESTDVGYVQGEPFEISLVTVDGHPVEVLTANAYYQMQQAAAADGVGLAIVSGFRTMAEQEYFYSCYINCNCNDCNPAAAPGYSNHQSGHALDLNTSDSGVYNWLAAHGDEWGFEATVPGENWHWEWWGGGPPATGPCGTPEYRAEYVAQSFPAASEPAVPLALGTCMDVWIELKNTGDAGWDGDTRLAPTPRDQESLLHDPNTWLSPTRIVSPGEVAPGAQGRFEFRLCASVLGEQVQTFGLIQEGVTWFADPPKGGGPADTLLALRILGVAAPSPDTGGTIDSGAGAGSGEASGSSGAPDDESDAAGPALPPSFGSDGESCACRGSSSASPGLLLLFGLFARRPRRSL